MHKWGKKILKMIQENKESKEQVKDQEIRRGISQLVSKYQKHFHTKFDILLYQGSDSIRTGNIGFNLIHSYGIEKFQQVLVVDLAHFDKAKKYQNGNRYGIEASKSPNVSKFCRKFISTPDQDINIKSTSILWLWTDLCFYT